jgi:hypothetical protein
LGKPYEDVYIAVRRVQSHRWERVAIKYGPVSHSFDAFGQIKPQHRRSVRKKQPTEEQSSPYRLWLIAVIALLLLWWLW